jgi:hypothetical protein
VSTSILSEIQRIQGLQFAHLQAEWSKLYDGEPCRSRNRPYLVRRLCWRVQELQLGGLSDATQTRLRDLAPDRFTRRSIPASFDPTAIAPQSSKAVKAKRDDRLPAAGTVITRRWRDRNLRLLVRQDGGFELDGKVYGSLSEAARAATGSRWNGWLFWRVTPRRRR